MIVVQVAPICQRGGLSVSADTTTSTETTTARPECPYGWETYIDNATNIKCFRFYGNTTYATYAEDECQTQGGHLASIHSTEEQSFLMQTFNPSNEVWIGLSKHDNVWQWTDESPFDFDDWLSGQPDGQSHTFMHPDDGKWRDYDYRHNYNYICQITFKIMI